MKEVYMVCLSSEDYTKSIYINVEDIMIFEDRIEEYNGVFGKVTLRDGREINVRDTSKQIADKINELMR